MWGTAAGHWSRTGYCVTSPTPSGAAAAAAGADDGGGGGGGGAVAGGSDIPSSECLASPLALAFGMCVISAGDVDAPVLVPPPAGAIDIAPNPAERLAACDYGRADYAIPVTTQFQKGGALAGIQMKSN